MDRDEAIRLLKSRQKGVELWNSWVWSKYATQIPSLMDVDLHGANLSGVDLSEADLSSADLSDADLSNSMLVLTDLELFHPQ